VFLNLGTHATIPDIPGLRAAKPLTHVETLELDRLPSHLIVLGGGYVGLEFAQAFIRFGSRVTVLERGSQLLPREDHDVATALLEFLHLDGVDVRLNVEVAQVEGSSGGSVRVILANSAWYKVELTGCRNEIFSVLPAATSGTESWNIP
jgi:pyruvate/2-oxoglutarate dehydrogenase complex dihydrolipoamide dehydrogenase (E3) component